MLLTSKIKINSIVSMLLISDLIKNTNNKMFMVFNR